MVTETAGRNQMKYEIWNIKNLGSSTYVLADTDVCLLSDLQRPQLEITGTQLLLELFLSRVFE